MTLEHYRCEPPVQCAEGSRSITNLPNTITVFEGVTLAKEQRWRTSKNALANVCRGGATAVVALALPHFLTRSLGGERFAAWSLMLQMSAIAAYFDFGLQTILGRFVAQAAERGEDETLSKLASTSMMLLAVASLFPLAACVLFLPLLPLVFHSSSVVILHEIQKGVAILVIGTALSLPLSACTGLLVGLHKNEIPALAIGASRLLGALTIIVCARYTGSLMILALCFTSWNLIGGVAQLLWVKRLLPSLRLTAQFYDGNLAKMLVRQSLVLTVLSFCMIIISNVDLTIVGHFNFIAVGPYSVATTLTTFLYGLNATVCAAFYAPIAVMEQRGDQAGIRTSLERLTLFTSLINMAVIVANYLLGKALLTLWVGPAYMPKTFPILQVLLAANAIQTCRQSFCSRRNSYRQAQGAHKRRGNRGCGKPAPQHSRCSLYGANRCRIWNPCWGRGRRRMDSDCHFTRKRHRPDGAVVDTLQRAV